MNLMFSSSSSSSTTFFTCISVLRTQKIETNHPSHQREKGRENNISNVNENKYIYIYINSKRT